MTHRDAFDQDIQIIAGDGISIAQTGTKQITISAGGSVTTWLRPSAQTVPDDTVLVQPGKYTRSTGVRLVDVPAALTSPAFATVTTGNKRCDLLQISDLGALSIKQGAEIPAATIIDPATHWPTLEADKLAIAIVLVTEDTTVVVDATDITDVREYLNKVGTASGGAGVDAKQNGSLILAGATAINFKGGVTVTDAGGGQADVEIEGSTVATRNIYNRKLVVSNYDNGCTGDQVKVLAGASLIASNGNSEISVETDLTLDITTAGANGLDTGSPAGETWYAIYLIKNPFTGNVAGLFSTNFTTPTLPAGYTLYRRIGAVYREAEVWTLVDRFGATSNWSLTGVTSGNTIGNSLFVWLERNGTLGSPACIWRVRGFKRGDMAATQEVFRGTYTGVGPYVGNLALTQQNASGVSGSVDVDFTQIPPNTLAGAVPTGFNSAFNDPNVLLRVLNAGERFVTFFQTDDIVLFPTDPRMAGMDEGYGRVLPSTGTTYYGCTQQPQIGNTIEMPTFRCIPETADRIDMYALVSGSDVALSVSSKSSLANRCNSYDHDGTTFLALIDTPHVVCTARYVDDYNSVRTQRLQVDIPTGQPDLYLYMSGTSASTDRVRGYAFRCSGYRDAIGSLLGGVGAVTEIHTRTFDVGTEVSATQGATFITALSAPVANEFVEGAPVKLTDGADTVYCIVESVAGLQVNLFGPDLTALGALTGVQQGDTERVRSLDVAAGQLWAEVADVGFNVLSTVGHRRYFWQYGLAAFVYGSAVAASVATTGGGLTVTAGGIAVSDEVLIQNTLTSWTTYAATQADVETGDEIELILGTADAGSTWLSGALNFVLQW